jgi:hypothetical protein
MIVNGYEVEQAPNGAWWVRRSGTRQSWRFSTKLEALRFVGQLRPGVAEEPVSSDRHTRQLRAG